MLWKTDSELQQVHRIYRVLFRYLTCVLDACWEQGTLLDGMKACSCDWGALPSSCLWSSERSGMCNDYVHFKTRWWKCKAESLWLPIVSGRALHCPPCLGVGILGLEQLGDPDSAHSPLCKMRWNFLSPLWHFSILWELMSEKLLEIVRCKLL